MAVTKKDKTKTKAAVTPPKGKRKRGRPAENKVLYRTVLRLPQTLAEKLKKAADRAEVSINTYVETALSVALSAK